MKNRDNIDTPLSKSAWMKYSFFPSTIQLWNKPPNDIKAKIILENFKGDLIPQKEDLEPGNAGCMKDSLSTVS